MSSTTTATQATPQQTPSGFNTLPNELISLIYSYAKPKIFTHNDYLIKYNTKIFLTTDEHIRLNFNDYFNEEYILYDKEETDDGRAYEIFNEFIENFLTNDIYDLLPFKGIKTKSEKDFLLKIFYENKSDYCETNFSNDRDLYYEVINILGGECGFKVPKFKLSNENRLFKFHKNYANVIRDKLKKEYEKGFEIYDSDDDTIGSIFLTEIEDKTKRITTENAFYENGRLQKIYDNLIGEGFITLLQNYPSMNMIDIRYNNPRGKDIEKHLMKINKCKFNRVICELETK